MEGSMGVSPIRRLYEPEAPPVKAPSFAAPPGPDLSTYFSTTPNLTPHFVTMN